MSIHAINCDKNKGFFLASQMHSIMFDKAKYALLAQLDNRGKNARVRPQVIKSTLLSGKLKALVVGCPGPLQKSK